MFHTQRVLGPGVKVRSGQRQGWKVGGGRWGRLLSVALRSLDFVWREIGSYRGFSLLLLFSLLFLGARSEKWLWLHYGEWIAKGNEIMVAWD